MLVDQHDTPRIEFLDGEGKVVTFYAPDRGRGVRSA